MEEKDYIVTYMMSFTATNGVKAKTDEEAKKKGLKEAESSLEKSSFINVADLEIEISYVEED